MDQRLVKAVGAGTAAILVATVVHFEGTVYRVYRDPVGIKTACSGHTGPEIQMGQEFTPDQCSEMLSGDLVAAAWGVQHCTGAVPLSDGELAAYTSFAFNVGIDAFCGSTALKKVKAGDRRGACAELGRWIFAKGQMLAGLVQRRAAEQALCVSQL